MNDLRNLPSVDQLLQTASALDMIASFGRPLTLDAIRTVLERVRKRVLQGGNLPSPEAILAQVGQLLQDWTRPTLRPLINALKTDDESLRWDAARSLEMITGEDFGEDHDRWQRWNSN